MSDLRLAANERDISANPQRNTPKKSETQSLWAPSVPP